MLNYLLLPPASTHGTLPSKYNHVQIQIHNNCNVRNVAMTCHDLAEANPQTCLTKGPGRGLNDRATTKSSQQFVAANSLMPSKEWPSIFPACRGTWTDRSRKLPGLTEQISFDRRSFEGRKDMSAKAFEWWPILIDFCLQVYVERFQENRICELATNVTQS